MNRLPKLAAFLALVFVLAACGEQSGGGSGAQEQEAGQEEQAAQESTQESQETQEQAAEESEPEAASPESGEEESSGGYGVTTLDGEEVRLGAEGGATAIFFMAGW